MVGYSPGKVVCVGGPGSTLGIVSSLSSGTELRGNVGLCAGLKRIAFAVGVWPSLDMAKWIGAGVVLLVLVGALLWPSSPESHRPKTTQARATQGDGDTAGATNDVVRPIIRSASSPPNTPSPANEQPDAAAMIDPKSEEFLQAIEEVAPARFRGEMAKCDYRKLDPNAKVRIHYRLRIINGQVLATDVRVGESEIEDADVQQCFVRAMQNTQWQSSDLPDYDQEEELLVRVRMLDKFRDYDDD